MIDAPKFPWQIDTNDRYRELVALVIGLATAALVVPVFLAREFLAIDDKSPLSTVFTRSAYIAWTSLFIAILAGLAFHMFSAKWVRLAWGQNASFLGVALTEKSCEKWLELTFWGTVLPFLFGIGATLWFFVRVVPST